MERKHHIAQRRVNEVLSDLARVAPEFVHAFPRPLEDIIQILYPIALIEIEDLTFRKIAAYLHKTGIHYEWPGDTDEGLAGFILFKSGYGLIFTEKNGSAGFRRFSKAHELGHFWDFRKAQNAALACRDLPGNGISNQAVDYSEVRANQFAAELLMPADLMKAYSKSSQKKDEMIIDVVERFGVSRAAAKIRLKEFGVAIE